MTDLTLEEAKNQLKHWLDASIAVSKSQSYRIESGRGGARQLTMVDASEIREQLDFWQKKVDYFTKIDSGGGDFMVLGTFGNS